IVALTALAQVARAELKWEQTSVDLQPAVGDKQAVAHFKYENVGKTPVHFTSVHASGGCTAAQTQKEQVAPGEKGEVTATFNIGGRTGTQVKTVTVQTDDPDPSRATTVLTLKAVITPLLEIQPALFYWQNGEEPKPKIINAKANKASANTRDGESAGDQHYPFHDPTRPGHTSGDSSVTQSITGERGPTSAIAHCARPCARNRRGDLFSQ